MILSSSVISRVTGTISSTVVTLSSSAEKTAVTRQSISSMPGGFALTRLAAQMATYWKMPHLPVIATSTIMPVSRPMVLKSTPRMAAS